MLISGNRLGDEGDPATEIRDDQRPVTRCLVFPSPQLPLTGPRPARPQGTASQSDRSSGGLCRCLRGWPERCGSLIDEWCQDGDVPRNRGLVHIEDLRPYLFGDVIAHISARNDQRLTQGEFPRTALAVIPWFLEQVADHLLQFVELLSV